MKKYLFLFSFLLLLCNTLFAAYLTDFPVEVKQPNGETVLLYVTGDEFYRRIHDAGGYTIIRDPQTGYLVYAVLKNNELVSSGYLVGKIDPKTTGLKANIDIPAEKKIEIRQDFFNTTPKNPNISTPFRANAAVGVVNNIVIFIRFADDPNFSKSGSVIKDYFNKDEQGESMYRYFYDISHGNLSVSSTFYPTSSGNVISSYRDTYKRSYYLPYNAVSNPNGYKGEAEGPERTAREQGLIKRAVDAVSSQIPSNLKLDNLSNGFVDNICFIIQGSSDGWSGILWPHKWSLYYESATINGKWVYDYNIQLENSCQQSVLVHEMYHTLGAPDLYRYENNTIEPVGSWDVMGYNSNPPQSSTAWITYKYGKWISNIPEITQSGTYTINNVWSATNNCYKIASPNSTTEFFMIEYRNKNIKWDSGIPGSGLLIYRVNPNVSGNSEGPPDELYVFRPGGRNTTINGFIGNANFNTETGRTTFSDDTNPPAFLSNNSAGLGGIVINEIGPSGGESMSFKVTFPTPVTITWLGRTPDWNDPANWEGGKVPSSMDIVIIPVNAANFPILTNNVSVAEIHFEPGAQIGNQSLLSGKAFVQYDFSNRERWSMLSIPLQQVYPGDFTFGGYPQTWVRTFTTSTNGNVTQGSWVTQRGSRTPFSFGDGFVLFLNDDNHSGEPVDNAKGLKLLNNTRELPFFQHHITGSPDYDIYHAVHQAHDYSGAEENGVSTFYNVVNNNGKYERVLDDPNQRYNVNRDESAYQLAGASVSKTVSDFINGSFALIGNPYMAVLDFSLFYDMNKTQIKPNYYIWTSNGYTIFTPYGTTGEDTGDNPQGQLIAPLQGFIVEKSETATNSQLSFNEDMTTVNKSVTLLRSSENGNKLDIVARNEAAGIRTFIAKREGGQDEFGNLDARKIINGISDVPEIYTLKPYKSDLMAVAVNIINSDDLLIPVDLATSYSGNITLSFSGMDAYDANLTLIDAVANREIDLTGLASYDYSFNYTPKKVNGETTICEDRFFIRISKTAVTGIKETIADKVNVYESNGLIQVVSSAANPIKEVAVYNLHGSLIYKESAIHAISHTVNRQWTTGAYIIKVVSEKNIDNIKLIIK